MELINMITNTYERLMSKADPRVNELPLMSSPLPTIAICSCYVLTVKVIGPRLMRDRPAFDMRHAMIAYNFFMVLVSASIVYLFSRYAWFNNYSLRCQPVDYSDSEEAKIVLLTSYLYFLVKFVEFIDTAFFVLRKKQSHISTLHVIHHGILPFSVWWGMKFVPGGHATFFGYINSFIHVIMYTYYGLAACGPKVQRFLWWKKYLTVFQMIQFVMIFTHAFQLLLYTDCSFPKVFALWIGAHGVLFWFLFSNFYDKAYNSKSKRSDGKANGKVSLSAADFVGMCSGKQHLLHENGHTNGYSNGKANGHSNGHISNGHTANGITLNGKANGQANGQANGYSNGHINGNGNGYSNGHKPTNGYANGKTNGIKVD